MKTNQPIFDWSRVHPYVPDGIHSPARLQDLVVTVQKIEAKGKKAKAIGSVWSLSNAPDSDDFVIDTSRLNRYLSQPFPPPPIPLSVTRPVVGGFPGLVDATFRSSNHNKPWLASWAHEDVPVSGRFLVHVEAGIKIRQLLQDLTSAGLAVRTMGAGGGQSLAGAISTGTHGSDVELSVLGDAVRAVHLVGPGGQEWWVEGNGGGGRRVGYAQWPGWCSDMRVIRDSDFLESLVVGVGRFGIIYSMVLEVVPQYRLEEYRQEDSWSNVRSALQSGVATGYAASGNVFDDPHGWTGRPLRFWNAVIDVASGSRTWVIRRWRTGNTVEVCGPVMTQISLLQMKLAALVEQMDKLQEGGPANPIKPPHDPAFQALVEEMKETQEELTDLKHKASELGCWPDEGIDKGTDLMGYFCTHDLETVTLVLSATGAVATTLYHLAMAAAAIPLVGIGLAGKYIALADELLTAAMNFKTLGEFAATVIDLLREFDGLGSHLIEDLIKEIAGGVLDGEHQPPTRRGASHRILDTHNYALDGCFSVDSAEFFFDASSASYLQFIDEVRGVAKSLGPLLGVIALRFTRQTRAKLGMQRFSRTVGVQVAVSRPGSANAEYMNKVHTLARQHGGVPHWGEDQRLDEARVQDLYGSDLDTWRWALAEAETGQKATFSSNFTRTRGLEAPDTLPAYRGRQYFAAIISGTY